MTEQLLSHAARLLNRAANIFDSDDPLVVVPYRGFASQDKFYLKGRVLENEGVFEGKSESQIRNLMDTLRRFESDEVAGATVALNLMGGEHLVTSDEEGYFTLERNWDSPLSPTENRWLAATARLVESEGGLLPTEAAPVEILLPSENASFGIISDIDDTVMQTHVTSRFKLKMLYATLFKDSHQRLPMEGIPDLLRALEKGGDQLRENPIFYVSDSPWNIYDLIVEFMALQNLPKGPILLRDYGLQMLKRNADNPIHKIESFRQIMKMYPDLPFVMLGDTASKDADFYLQMAEEFSGRILAIYIRETRDTKNARRIEKLIEANSNIAAVRVHSSQEIWEDAKRRGLVG
jgi:phosphatidate phosphatase APP1